MKITEITTVKQQIATKIRLAAYCRVSSDSTDQLHSFAAQIRYYSEYTKANPEYELVGIYADEGLTGTEMKKRDELNRLLKDCQKGKIDRIIVKSVSRFARNTEELLVTLRLLKDFNVCVYFEEQGIDTDKLNMEMIVTFPGMAAQQESVNISGNMRWSYQKRMQSGEFNCTCPAYGYRLVKGEMTIEETEAIVVRRIFNLYLQGLGTQAIANILNDEVVPRRYITFIGSMFIANDMALLTFLPLGYFVLSTANKKRYMAFTFIMQNIAANLGGMLTPFGNPQNLYLYTKYQIPDLEFIKIMAPPFLLSVAAITVCCIAFIKPEPLALCDERVVLDPKKTILYLALFVLAIVIVFRTIPYWIGLIIIPGVLLFADRKALKMVDYGLLFTFVFFFVFAGNMARIEAVRDLFSMLLKKNTLLFSVVSCQVISNVPSAILLSQFTGNYPELLVGVNIGGVGTLISSLASLITFREYVKHNPGKAGSYIKEFSLFNFAFLIILTGFMLVLQLL